MPESRRHLGRLASESAVYSTAGIITRFLTFLLVPVFTRVFSPADYGTVGLINATLAAVGLFAILGLNNAAARWFWDTDEIGDRRVTISTWLFTYLTTSTLLAAGLFLLAPSLASVTLEGAGTEIYRIAALTIPLAVMGVVVNNVLRMQRRPWATATFALASGLATLGLSVVFVVWMDGGVAGLYWAQVSAGAFSTVLGVVVLRGWIRPRWFALSRLRPMLRYALPLVPAALAVWMVNLSDRYFLKVFTSDADVGLYQVSNAIAATVGFITAGFQQAWNPFALSFHRDAQAKHIYSQAMSFYAVVAGLIAAAVSVAAPELIRLVATPSYAGAADAVPYLALAYVALGATFVAGIGSTIARSTGPVAASVGWAALVNTTLNFALIPRLGGVGAGIATLGGWVVMAAYLFLRSHDLYPIPYRFGSVATFLAVTLLVGVAGNLWRPDDLVLAVVGKSCLVALLVPVALVLRAVTPAQLRALRPGRDATPEPPAGGPDPVS